MKKSIAIVFTLAAVLLCGFPGVLIITGKLGREYFSSPAETAYLCGGILILLPIVTAYAAFSNIGGGLKDVLSTGCLTITVLAIVSPLIAMLIFFIIKEGWPGIQTYAWQKQHQSLQTELGVVCKGTGVPSAAEYKGGAGIHPIILFNQDGEADRFILEVPNSWLPTDVSSAEIVACIERSEQVIETCQYDKGPPIQRYQSQVVFHLFAARTGEEIDSKVFYGTLPDECPAATKASDTTRTGGSVSFSDIQPWLEQIIQE